MWTGGPSRVLLLLIAAYKVIGSPWLGGRCRFVPSCSSYASEAVLRHGALKGSAFTLWRLARCHPLSRGGLDQVPLSRVSRGAE